MAPSEFPVSDGFSIKRVTDHLAVMRRFQLIFQSIQSPEPEFDWTPPVPSGIDTTQPDVLERWRVQAFLMTAEVRHSLYLDFLHIWVAKNRSRSADKEKWPLPPWDVAIIFYTHLLMPQRFRAEAAAAFPTLWAAKIEFPLARLAQTLNDEASELAWKSVYPNIPYQIVVLTHSGSRARLAGPQVLDIHHFRCLSKSCSPQNKEQIIPMADWSNYRLGITRLLCPTCEMTYSKLDGFNGRVYHAMCQIAFGVEVWELWDAPLRQFGSHGFIETILSLVGSGPTAHAQQRYLRFLQLIKGSIEVFVPTVDIDLFWHTHQLSPTAYSEYCVKWVGKTVNHDDSIASPTRSGALDNTKKSWALTYAEAFLDPENAERCALIASKRAVYLEKKEVMNEELRMFDRSHQAVKDRLDEAEERAKRALQTVVTLRTEANGLGKQFAAKRYAIQYIRPRVSLFGLKYYSTANRQKIHALQADQDALTKAREGKRAEAEERQRECGDLEKERDAIRKEWRTVLGKKDALHGRLARQVAEAETAVYKESMSPPKRDEKGGPIYSVVGSEAHPTVPVLGATDRGRTVVTWRDSWRKAKTKTPMALNEPRYNGLQRYRDASGGSGGDSGYGGYGGYGGGGWGLGDAGCGGGGGYGGCGGGGSSGGCGGGGGSGGGGGCGGGGCGGGGG